MKSGTGANNLISEGRGVKRTSIGRGTVKKSSMNKRKKASFKKYRGQG
jgi:hypothetical protein